MYVHLTQDAYHIFGLEEVTHGKDTVQQHWPRGTYEPVSYMHVHKQTHTHTFLFDNSRSLLPGEMK